MMGRRLKFIFLLLACLAGVAVVKTIAFPTPHDPSPELRIAGARLDAIESALSAYASDNGSYPLGSDWIAQIGLAPEEAADPFSAPSDSEPLLLWTDGRWYAVASYGPDGHGQPVRYFQSQFLDQATPRELERLLGENGIVSDIRFRSALYDPTNGLLTWGDLVRWGGPSVATLEHTSTVRAGALLTGDTASPEI